MQSIARGELRGLHGQAQGEAIQLLNEYGTLREELLQSSRLTSIGSPVTLGHDPGGAGPVSHQQRQANETFVSDESDFHTFPSHAPQD